MDDIEFEARLQSIQRSNHWMERRQPYARWSMWWLAVYVIVTFGTIGYQAWFNNWQSTTWTTVSYVLGFVGLMIGLIPLAVFDFREINRRHKEDMESLGPPPSQ